MLKKLTLVLALVVLAVSSTFAMGKVRVYGTQPGLTGSQNLVVSVNGHTANVTAEFDEGGGFSFIWEDAAYVYSASDLLTVRLDGDTEPFYSRRMDILMSDQSIVGALLNNPNTWTASQVFIEGVGLANNKIVVNDNGGATNLPQLLFYDDENHTNWLGGFGPNGAGYGLRMNDNAGNQRAGIGYYDPLTAYVAGVSNDGNDMAGVMTTGANDNMNIQIRKDAVVTFDADIDGNMIANDLTVNDIEANDIEASDVEVDNLASANIMTQNNHAVVDVTTIPALQTEIAGDFTNGFTVQDNAILSADIADGNVATADIADNAVTTGKILDGTIATADIADGAVATAKIADNAVTTGKILDGTIVNADIANNAAIAVSKLGATPANNGQFLGVSALGVPNWVNLGDLTVAAASPITITGAYNGSVARELDLALAANSGLQVVGNALGIKTAVTGGITVDATNNLIVDESDNFNWTGLHTVIVNSANHAFSIANGSVDAGATGLYINYSNGALGAGIALLVESNTSSNAFEVYNDGTGVIAHFEGTAAVVIENDGSIEAEGDLTVVGKTTTGALAVGLATASNAINLNTESYVVATDDGFGTKQNITYSNGSTPTNGQVIYVNCQDGNGFTMSGADPVPAVGVAGHYVLIWDGANWIQF